MYANKVRKKGADQQLCQEHNSRHKRSISGFLEAALDSAKSHAKDVGLSSRSVQKMFIEGDETHSDTDGTGGVPS